MVKTSNSFIFWNIERKSCLLATQMWNRLFPTIFNKGSSMWLKYGSSYFINLWISYRNRARINTEFLRNGESATRISIRESQCESTLKPAIHLLSNWRKCEKMLAKREVYRWHFANCYANHFLISRFTVLARWSVFSQMWKRTIQQVSHQVSRRIKDEWNRRYCEKCIVIGSQSQEIVHKHVETRETISV